jgi:hypothetical protein
MKGLGSLFWKDISYRALSFEGGLLILEEASSSNLACYYLLLALLSLACGRESYIEAIANL